MTEDDLKKLTTILHQAAKAFTEALEGVMVQLGGEPKPALVSRTPAEEDWMNKMCATFEELAPGVVKQYTIMGISPQGTHVVRYNKTIRDVTDAFVRNYATNISDALSLLMGVDKIELVGTQWDWDSVLDQITFIFTHREFRPLTIVVKVYR